MSKLLIGCALLATLEPFGSFCHVNSLFSGAVLCNCYYYREVCITSLDVAVPVTVAGVSVVAG